MDKVSMRFEGKQVNKVPEGATIIKKSVDISVEEIENGFILKKSYDINYTTIEGNSDYLYFTKKWFTEENPISIDEEVAEETSLADKFE